MTRDRAKLLASRVTEQGAYVKLTRRADGRFRVRWRDPSRREGESTHRVRRDADAAFDEVWGRINQGLVGRRPEGTFGELGDQVMVHDHQHWASHGPRAWHDLEALWVNKIKGVVGEVPTNKFTQSNIESVFDMLRREGYSQSTFSKVRKILRHICNQGVADGVWPEHKNPMWNLAASVTKADIGGPSDGRIILDKMPTEDEVNALIAAGWEIDERIGFIFQIAARGGLRFSEITALTPNDFELSDDGTATVYVRKSKTRAGTRWVPLGSETVKAIKQMLDGTDPGDLIIRTANDRPMSRSQAQRKITDARGLSGYPSHRGGVHYLRHFFAWSMLSAGAPIVDVSRVLGHASAAVTLSIYADAEAQTAATSVARYVK